MLSCTSGQVKHNRNLHIYKETYTFKYFLLKLYIMVKNWIFGCENSHKCGILGWYGEVLEASLWVQNSRNSLIYVYNEATYTLRCSLLELSAKHFSTCPSSFILCGNDA